MGTKLYIIYTYICIVLYADRARDQFKARVNEVAYIKADNKVSQSVRVSECGRRKGGVTSRMPQHLGRVSERRVSVVHADLWPGH